MTKTGVPLAGLALAAAMAFAAPAQANLVANGSFETEDFSGWTQTGDIDLAGVQCPGADASVFAGGCSAYFGTTAVGGITQEIDVGRAGLSWNLSFALKPDGGTPGSFAVRFGGQTLLSLVNPAAADYTLYQFSGLTTGGTMTLAFDFSNAVGLTFFDAVSVTAVPEPGSVGLMGAGLAALVLAARRRARAAR